MVRVGSTNAHVGIYQIYNLPCPIFADALEAADEALQDKALSALASGSVDPLRTVLLESAPPPLAAPRDPAADAARIVSYAPNRMELRTRTDAPGLLVLSEGYDPGWRAEIDGQPAPVLVANHALRAVSLPAGEHTVRLRYAPPALRWGIAISLGGYLTLGILLVTFRLGPRLHPAGRRALVSLSPRDRAIGHVSGAIEVGRDDSVVTRHHRSSSAPYSHPRHGQNTNRGATQHATPSIGTLPVSSSRSDHADHDRTARRDRPAPLRP